MILFEIFIALFWSFFLSMFVYVLGSYMVVFAGWERMIPLPDSHWPIFWVIATLFVISVLHERLAHRARKDFFAPASNRPMPGSIKRVLYLRSFVFDEITLAGKATTIDASLKAILPENWQFLALGENNKVGIRMDGHHKEDWQSRLVHECQSADFILICPIASPSLEKEIALLAETTLWQKTLMITPGIMTNPIPSTILGLVPASIRSLYFRLVVAPRELPADFPRPAFSYAGYLSNVWQYSTPRLKHILTLPDMGERSTLSTLAFHDGRLRPGETFPLDHEGILKAFGKLNVDGVIPILRALQSGSSDASAGHGADLGNTTAAGTVAYAGFGLFGGNAGGDSTDGGDGGDARDGSVGGS